MANILLGISVLSQVGNFHFVIGSEFIIGRTCIAGARQESRLTRRVVIQGPAHARTHARTHARQIVSQFKKDCSGSCNRGIT